MVHTNYTHTTIDILFSNVADGTANNNVRIENFPEHLTGQSLSKTD